MTFSFKQIKCFTVYRFSKLHTCEIVANYCFKETSIFAGLWETWTFVMFILSLFLAGFSPILTYLHLSDLICYSFVKCKWPCCNKLFIMNFCFCPERLLLWQYYTLGSLKGTRVHVILVLYFSSHTYTTTQVLFC